MVNKKKVILYCCMTLLLIIYLVKANDIILLLDADDKVKKVSFGEMESNTEVRMYLDNSEYVGGILEKVYFQGWAFCETLYDNSDKKISLVFKSIDSDDCYIVDTLPQLRPDVDEVVSGIECQFSTIKINDGVYDFYVYVQENEYNYGLYDTQTRYVKEEGEFTEVEEYID